MSSKILIKRSTTSGSVPTTSDLDTGELGLNTADKRVYTNNAGTIVELGTYPSSLNVTGNTDLDGTLNVDGASTLASGTVTGNWTVTGTLTVSTPTNSTDAASKGYVDTADALKVAKSGDTMSGNLAMGSNKVTGLATPTDSADAATKGYVDAQVTAVIDSAPAALDTLNELAAALNDDANFATTITNALATKLPLAGGTMTGNIVMGGNKVTSTATPTTDDDLTRKGYVDTQDATKLNLSGGTMTGDVVLGANKITSTATPATDDTLTRKGYVDSILGSATDAATSAAAAATSASNAATSASDASTSATASAASATAAASSASAASTSETNAATSASSASTSATAAATSATNAATSATNAAASYDAFDDRYLGSKSSAPSVDNDGDALVTGALYFDTTAGGMYVYTGSAWEAAYSGASGFVANTGDSMTGDLSFGDGDKAIFGAGSDLEIYHDGSNSYIQDVGTGNLYLDAANNLIIRDQSDGNWHFSANSGGEVKLYYSNSPKLATTSTGIDVTGTVETDRATGTVTTDNDLSFDMSATNNFSCTPSGTGTLTFTNITSGQSGNIYLDNSGGHVISAAATTFISAADLTKISTAGKYFVSYYSADGTNVLVSASSAVTAQGV